MGCCCSWIRGIRTVKCSSIRLGCCCSWVHGLRTVKCSSIRLGCCCSWVRGSCACCCSWISGLCGRKKREAGKETSTSETKKTKRKWRRSFCGWTSHEAKEPLTSETKKKREAGQEASTSETKKTKRKWGRGFCGWTSHEAEEPSTSETKKKRKNGASSSEPDKKRWFKNKIWRNKKAKNKQLATLVKEISLPSNALHHLIIHLCRETKFSNACQYQIYQ
uniref:Uncharacterized protein n=1 Tax=Aegilops tauschii subsp. strangulata TaxID=200361 RepID=A0A452ZG80_AEGTS